MKKVLLTILLILVWIAVLVPLALAVFLATTIIGWPIYFVTKIVDDIQSRPLGMRNSETVEEGIFVIYALALLLMCIPLELPALRKQVR